MSKHDYSKYSNHNNKRNDSEVAANHEDYVSYKEPVTVAEAEHPAEVKMVVETDETVTRPETKTVTGVVTKCAKLNVREQPSIDSDVVCVLDSATKIEINVAESTDEWFRVRTATGIDGYCMRKFVDARL